MFKFDKDEEEIMNTIISKLDKIIGKNDFTE